jgi:hypothetical protein
MFGFDGIELRVFREVSLENWVKILCSGVTLIDLLICIIIVWRKWNLKIFQDFLEILENLDFKDLEILEILEIFIRVGF